jgi:hypothetical protein
LPTLGKTSGPSGGKILMLKKTVLILALISFKFCLILITLYQCFLTKVTRIFSSVAEFYGQSGRIILKVLADKFQQIFLSSPFFTGKETNALVSVC